MNLNYIHFAFQLFRLVAKNQVDTLLDSLTSPSSNLLHILSVSEPVFFVVSGHNFHVSTSCLFKTKK